MHRFRTVFGFVRGKHRDTTHSNGHTTPPQPVLCSR